jgi:hypothetical protein
LAPEQPQEAEPATGDVETPSAGNGAAEIVIVFATSTVVTISHELAKAVTHTARAINTGSNCQA